MRRTISLCVPLLLLLPACRSMSPEASQAQHEPADVDANVTTPEAESEPTRSGGGGGGDDGEQSNKQGVGQGQGPSKGDGAGEDEIVEPDPAPGGGEDGPRVAVISGGLDRDIIRRKAKDHASDVQGCVPKALAQNPALSELLSIELTIDAKGSVSEAQASEDSPFTLSEVERCVLELAKDWSFPPADNGEDTTATLEFYL